MFKSKIVIVRFNESNLVDENFIKKYGDVYGIYYFHEFDVEKNMPIWLHKVEHSLCKPYPDNLSQEEIEYIDEFLTELGEFDYMSFETYKEVEILFKDELVNFDSQKEQREYIDETLRELSVNDYHKY